MGRLIREARGSGARRPEAQTLGCTWHLFCLLPLGRQTSATGIHGTRSQSPLLPSGRQTSATGIHGARSQSPLLPSGRQTSAIGVHGTRSQSPLVCQRDDRNTKGRIPESSIKDLLLLSHLETLSNPIVISKHYINIKAKTYGMFR